jgi:hypothetical protein
MAEQMRGGKNLGLVATRQVTRPQFEHVFVAQNMIEIKACSHDRNTQIFPLFIVDNEGELKFSSGAVPNLSPEAIAILRSSIGITKTKLPKTEAEADFARRIFEYVYAILHARSYRSRYFGFLRSDFPRIPLKPSKALFSELSSVGAKLIGLHLLESPILKKPTSRYFGEPEPNTEKPTYDEQTKTIWVNRSDACGFRAVEGEVWSFRIGGYQVCEKWLKDRKGSTLSSIDVEHYERILFAIEQTLLGMTEIDGIIEKHGGWPSAFVEKSSPL